MRFTSRITSWLILFATLLMWSGNWIVARAVRDDVAPGLATGGRLLLVLAILGPITFDGLRRKLPRLSVRDWWLLAALGITGGGINMYLQWLGLHYTTATSGVLYLSVTPVFILLFALPLGERMGLMQLTGVATSFCGVAAIAAQGDPARLASLSFNIGDMMALASMVLFAAYTVLLRVQRLALGPVELLTMVCAFGLVSMLPWIGWELASGAEKQINLAGGLGIAYSAVCSQLLAYLGWSHVVMRLGASLAGVNLHLMPAIGVAMSALLLHEYPAWFHFLGIALILAGVTLSSGKLKIRRTSTQERTQ